MSRLFSAVLLVVAALEAVTRANPCHPKPLKGLGLKNNTAVGGLGLKNNTALGGLNAPSLTGISNVKLNISVPPKLQPVLNLNFPDPGLIQGEDGNWYSYATSGYGYRFQVAKAPHPLGPWNHSNYDAMSGNGWSTGRNMWAPDVRHLDDGSFIMYWTGELNNQTNHLHCIGTARSKTAAGPFTPDPEPFVCRNENGGVIDASGFKDPATGKRYVIYKSEGTFGQPPVATPHFIQEVGPDGATKIGGYTMINHQSDKDGDGVLVEAPNMVYYKGAYILFFSSHFFTDSHYDVKWAWAISPLGPFTRGGELVHAPMGGTNGPGGATSSEDGKYIVFHAWCAPPHVRCLYASEYEIEVVM